ncbi:MAG: 16S rRNA (cytidine(1402)-2'-O)-methyltransferase [Marinilabiliales bacterium]
MSKNLTSGKLFLIPTPIGNLKDITYRAIETLRIVDEILTEDTRKTSILLKNYDIQNKVSSYHKFNEHKILDFIIKKLKNGMHIGLVTDAGTPGISDPGFLIVRECINNEIEVECLPGPTALIPALINSGLPCDKFCFEGFLPHKKGRKKTIENLKNETRTMVFYESPYRLLKTLNEFSLVFGLDRKASVSREISKIHEETKRGTIEELINYFSEKNIKGEIVIVIDGKK